MKKLYVFSMIAVLFCGGTVFGQVKVKPKPKSKSAPMANIVGGGNTTIDQQPWQVSLNVGCGGSIIGPNTVLTAAHCVDSYSPSQIQVYAGVTFRSGPASQSGTAVIQEKARQNTNSRQR